MGLRILVIDDDKVIRDFLRLRLSKRGYEVETAPDGQAGLDKLRNREADIVITDLKMPGFSGEELVRRVKAAHPRTEVVVITAYGTIESAVEVMKRGAYDFLLKPLNFDQVLVILEKIASKLALEYEHLQLKERYHDLTRLVEEKHRLHNIIGRGKKTQEIFELIENISSIDSTVLITGQTGTGKELVARAIHFNSTRKDGPFVPVDCGALPESLLESELFGHEKGAFTGATKLKRGRFERAHGGTLLLDEIGNATLGIQQKLLRAIQEERIERLGGESPIKIDVRIIAASNQDLEQGVRDGRFRQDLFYRLNVIPIHIPPLRERQEDIPLLASHFIKAFSKKINRKVTGLSEACLGKMIRYTWPGNVRELENLIERAVATTRERIITSLDFSEQAIASDHGRKCGEETYLTLTQVVNQSASEAEKAYLKEMLARHGGRLNRVAEQSGISVKTLYRKMQAYGFRKEDYKK